MLNNALINQCWRIWRDFWRYDSDQHCIGGKGWLFLLKSDNVCQYFFHDCSLPFSLLFTNLWRLLALSSVAALGALPSVPLPCWIDLNSWIKVCVICLCGQSNCRFMDLLLRCCLLLGCRRRPCGLCSVCSYCRAAPLSQPPYMTCLSCSVSFRRFDHNQFNRPFHIEKFHLYPMNPELSWQNICLWFLCDWSGSF